jgi:hypothetical protein
MDRRVIVAVSGALVTCMLVETSEGLAHGKAPSEVHLITSAPLVPGSSGSALAMDYYTQHNAIHDAMYVASLPRESDLRLGGLTTILLS